jgi:hypothetical protein
LLSAEQQPIAHFPLSPLDPTGDRIPEAFRKIMATPAGWPVDTASGRD